MKNRRRMLRSLSRVPLDLYDPKGRMIVGEGQFRNMSETGGLLESRKPLKPRAKIRLHIDAGKASPLQMAGKVVWAKRHARRFTYGIEFLRVWTPTPLKN